MRHLPARKGMRYIFISDNEDSRFAKWTALRAFLSWHDGPRSSEYTLEWKLFPKLTKEFPCGFGFGFDVKRDTGSDRVLHLGLYFGPLGSVWFGLDNALLRKICRVRPSKPYASEGRRYCVQMFHYQGSWWHLDWAVPTNTWSHDIPGIRWSSGAIHHKVFGYEKSEWETTFGPGVMYVKLPEGVYETKIKRERIHKWYDSRIGKLWTKIKPLPTWESWDIDIPGGIPIEGKGENSYDCGMDGLYSIHMSADELGPIEAVQKLIETVMRDRDRYGGPHKLPRAMTVKEADEWQKAQR